MCTAGRGYIYEAPGVFLYHPSTYSYELASNYKPHVTMMFQFYAVLIRELHIAILYDHYFTEMKFLRGLYIYSFPTNYL